MAVGEVGDGWLLLLCRMAKRDCCEGESMVASMESGSWVVGGVDEAV